MKINQRKNLSSASQLVQAFSYWASLDASSTGGKQIKVVNYSLDINIFFVAKIVIMNTSVVELHHNIILIGITGNIIPFELISVGIIE